MRVWISGLIADRFGHALYVAFPRFLFYVIRNNGFRLG